MNYLILKLNATGDVVRTTPLLSPLKGSVTWVTSQNNVVLLEGVAENLRCVSWEDRSDALESIYDLVINLEDDADVATFADQIRCRQKFGAYLGDSGKVQYTQDSNAWFDLGLISRYGRQTADELKFANRRTYQELIFEGLGFQFQGEKYFLPHAGKSELSGDVAIAPAAGPVWPMKSWAYYGQLRHELELRGLKVNYLPHRPSLLEHIGDIRNHRVLVAGDSLPMHLGLGLGVRCVTIFNCTSPWEIFDYGLLTKIVSPLLGEFFYKRGADTRATTVVQLDTVVKAVVEALTELRRG